VTLRHERYGERQLTAKVTAGATTSQVALMGEVGTDEFFAELGL
jgi:hypothetical protein